MSKIELHDLTKSYDGKVNILEKINLDVEEGEFYVLVGPSGCGKSTLLRVIAGLEKITDGTLKIDGKIANHMLPKDRNLSMVFQNYALYPHMTVKDNILFGLEEGTKGRAEAPSGRGGRDAGADSVSQEKAEGIVRWPASACGTGAKRMQSGAALSDG